MKGIWVLIYLIFNNNFFVLDQLALISFMVSFV